MIDIAPLTQVADFILEREQLKHEFYSIWLARHVLTRQIVSIKVFSKEFVDSNEQNQNYFNTELEIFKQSTNPFIARFIGDISDEKYYYLILEPLKGGTFAEFINDKTRLKETQTRPYFIQLFIVIEYIQKVLKYVAANICFEVFMLDESNCIRMIDFWGAVPVHDTSNASQLYKRDRLFSPLKYQPPEFVDDNLIYPMIDLWGLGVMVYRIAIGDFPFNNDENPDDLKDLILRNKVVYPKFLSNQLTDLIRKLLHTVPMQRPRLDVIKQHPWFSQTQYNVLTPFLLQEIKFNNEVFADVEPFVESKDDLHRDLAAKKTTRDVIIYKIAFVVRSAFDVYNACASTTTIPTDSVRINSDSGLSMTSARQFTSSPSMPLSALNTSTEKFKIKPLALQNSRPVPIAARRSSNLLLSQQSSMPKFGE